GSKEASMHHLAAMEKACDPVRESEEGWTERGSGQKICLQRSRAMVEQRKSAYELCLSEEIL
ncbi:MAG: hypothetical protein ACK443_09425, partial [Methylococcaceae bacterium]